MDVRAVYYHLLLPPLRRRENEGAEKINQLLGNFGLVNVLTLIKQLVCELFVYRI